jgi:aromatic-amino-acid transaminase
VVLLHACCHNPTGVDLSAAQWTELARCWRAGSCCPTLDLAYQGYGDGIEEDAWRCARWLAGRPSFLLPTRFQQEHERVRRALRRAVGAVRIG